MSIKQSTGEIDSNSVIIFNTDIDIDEFYSIDSITTKYTKSLFKNNDTILLDLLVSPNCIMSADFFMKYTQSINKLSNKQDIKIGYYKGGIKNYFDIINENKSDDYICSCMINTTNILVNNFMILFIENNGYAIKIEKFTIISTIELDTDTIDNKDERKERHIAKASYINTIFNDIALFYAQEIQIFNHQRNTYYACNFVGGYIGLAKDRKQINFSIWNSDNGSAELIDYNKKLCKYKQFTSDGTGIQISMKYNIVINNPYCIILKKYYDAIYTYYKGLVYDKINDILLYLGIIRRPGKFTSNKMGLFIENPASNNGHILQRSIQLNASNVYTDLNLFNTGISTYLNKDPRNSLCQFNNSCVVLSIGANIGEDTGNIKNKDTFILNNVVNYLDKYIIDIMK